MNVIRNIIITLFLCLFMFGLKELYRVQLAVSIPSTVSLGFMLLAAYSFAQIIANIGLPRLTGYIFMGIIAGPFLLSFISAGAISKLGLINELAIILIALTAGGEFRLESLRQNIAVYLKMLLIIVASILVGIFLSIILAGQLLFGAYELSFAYLFVLALMLAVTGIAKSPATTIAIINESQARGKVTDSILSMVILLDITVIFLFTFSIAFSRGLIEGKAFFEVKEFFRVLYEVFGGVIVGLILGALVGLYLYYVRANLLLFVFGVCVLVAVLAETLGMEPILMALAIGFFISNFSRQGHHLVAALERGSLPVYVVFFTLAGAGLKLDFLIDNWVIAIYLAVITGVFTFFGAIVGAYIARAESAVKKYTYLGLISQAGLSLGLAVIVKNELPAPIGELLFTFILARIAINQIIGPILLRFALVKAGEVTTSE